MNKKKFGVAKAKTTGTYRKAEADMRKQVGKVEGMPRLRKVGKLRIPSIV